jgi:hypothetical protein
MSNQKLTEEDRELVYLFLLHMDGYSWSKSSRRLEAALLYLMELEDPEDHQVKEVYSEVAIRTGGDWRAAERSLRHAIQRLWAMHTEECSKLFYHSSDHVYCPTVSEFLYIFHTANKRNLIRLWVETAEGRSLSIYALGFRRNSIIILDFQKPNPSHTAYEAELDGFCFCS